MASIQRTPKPHRYLVMSMETRVHENTSNGETTPDPIQPNIIEVCNTVSKAIAVANSFIEEKRPRTKRSSDVDSRDEKKCDENEGVEDKPLTAVYFTINITSCEECSGDECYDLWVVYFKEVDVLEGIAVNENGTRAE